MPMKNRPAPKSIRLPKEQEQILEEEMSSTGRSRSGIITEALSIRRAVLDVLGMEAGGTEAADLPELVAQHLRRGLKARR